MKRIKYGRNWNNKLDRDLHTTIRRPLTSYYTDGQNYEEYLGEEKYNTVQLIASRYIKLYDITEEIAQEDIGDSKEKLIGLLQRMYKIPPDQNPVFFLLVLKVIRD